MKTSRHLLSIGLIAWQGHCASQAATVDVDIMNFMFVPPSVTIGVGDAVRWTERDGAFHSSTSDTGVWDSGSLNVGASFSFTFPNAGAFPYHCTPHPMMMGSVTVQGAPNTPPTVEITSPTNNAVFNPPASVTIVVAATDAEGSVTNVEFFNGTSSLGSDTSSPFSITNTLPPGLRELTAVATDNDGAKATSAVVRIKVPITDPFPTKIAKGDIMIDVQTVADGMAAPVSMAVPDDGSGRMFVYDQAGLIYVVTSAGKLATPLLDIRSRLVVLGAYDERGLLGAAVHPNFAQNPFIYTYTSEPNAGTADFVSTLSAGVTNNHQSVIAEWRIDAANTNRVDISSRREVMRIDQPQSNHNGGAMSFGPDGLLYVALGDGGAADDEGEGHSPGGNGQNTNNIWGGMIRIDPRGTNSVNGSYGVPTDNPFVNAPGLDEIYAYGLRNPFSFSFDKSNGDLYLADVGQNRIEEVVIIVKGGNYGWPVKEGSYFFDGNGTGGGFILDQPVRPVPPGLIDPIAEYDHDEGLAVVGGFLYRGTNIPALTGRYVFGDWGTFAVPSGRLFYLDASNTIKEFRLGLSDRPLGQWIRGFGQDASGEIYVFVSKILGPAGNTGRMLKLIPGPDSVAITSINTGGGNATNTWTGGLGPFALQKKQTLNEPFCGNVLFTTNRTAAAPMDTTTAFFRVTDAGREPAIAFSAAMSGLAERPTPLTNTATGLGLFSLDGNTLRFDIKYSGLSGPANNAHIHGPATAAQSTGVMIDLVPFNGGTFGTSGTLYGVVVLTDAQKAIILSGRSYVNIHTAANQPGELRGQITPVLMEACLTGLAERPNPVTNNASGSATLALVGTNLSFTISYTGLSGPANNAHFHGPTNTSASASVIIDLAPFNGGSFGMSGTLAGTVSLSAAQLAMFVDGLVYVNIHTVAHQPGEIRGQVLPQAAGVPLTAALSGLNERPTPLTNTTSGVGIFSLHDNRLTFNIRYAGLSGNATAGHIHGPSSAGLAAPVLIDLAPFNGGSWGAQGTIAGSVILTPAQKAMVLNGQTYVNLHTAANQPGETRGQIAPVLMFSSLSGVNERPTAIVSPGIGSGTHALVWTNLTTVVTYAGLTSLANNAHIHGPAGLLGAASVLVDLVPFNGGSFGTSGAITGVVPLPYSVLAHVIDLQTYVNIHTTINGPGEIRGQITR